MKESYIRKLNPITKGVSVIIYICLISFFCKSWIVALNIVSFNLLLCLWCKEDVISMIFSLRKIWLLILIVVIFQSYSNNGIDIYKGLNSMFRIIGVFFIATTYTKISNQSELLYFWELFFKPFGIFGLTSNELALMMVIAIRFLPVFISEIDRIKMAQLARGAKLRKSKFFSMINFMPLLVPVLHQSIRRSEELADAMEARGYVPDQQRGRYKIYTFKGHDFVFIAVSLFVAYYLIMF